MGTCRLHDPINSIIGNISVLNEKNPSFVHNTKEIIQRINYFKGTYKYKKVLRSYQIKNNSVGLRNGVRLSDIDFFLIEISSRKMITFEGHYLQWNNTINSIKKLDVDYSKIWINSLHNSLKQNLENCAIITKNISSEIPKEDNEIISFLCAGTQSFIDLNLDMLKIKKLTNGKCIFVTHVDVQNSSGHNIPPRVKLIENITSFCIDNDIFFINPTDMLLSIGQEQMMDSKGLSVNHYNPEILDKIGQFFLNQLNDIKNRI
tara:strand:- start:136 stop:918 length:783 start_codon:yes stop_codon:yes gene_type:complete